MKLSNTVLVSVVAAKNRQVPLDFPWLSINSDKGVMLSLQGDMSDVHNLQQELQEVKNLVNKDASKFGIKLRDLNIDIKFKAEY